jgi:hypothetical protein
LLLSVPARKRLWTRSDVWAGHYRRYEKAELRALLQRVGLQVSRLESYGFPLANCVEPMRARVHRKSIEVESEVKHNRQQMTDRSGTDRAALISLFPLYSRFPGAALMWGFCQVQRLFLRYDWGTGYLAVSRRIC